MELDVQLGLRNATTASSAVLTLPAVTMDLKDWMADERKFLPVHYDD